MASVPFHHKRAVDAEVSRDNAVLADTVWSRRHQARLKSRRDQSAESQDLLGVQDARDAIGRAGIL